MVVEWKWEFCERNKPVFNSCRNFKRVCKLENRCNVLN